MIRTFGVLTLLTMLWSCSSNEESINSYIGFDIEKQELDSYLEEQMQQRKIPGMAIAFIEEGQVVHYNTFGYANVQDGIPVTKSTIFEAASLSKPIFAFFVMKYVEEGKLDLDTPLYTYLPYPDIAHDERYKKITARMVLSHRSGFPNWRGDYPENELFIQFEPGSDYFYSGEGYMYLSKVLKHLDQTDWEGLERAFQAKVAVPSGMQHSVFIQDEYSKRNKAEPYDENMEWISPERDRDSIVRFQFMAPASLHSEPLDFSKWLITMMEEEGLQASSYEELFTVHSYVDQFNGINVDYTLGFFKPQIPFTNIYMHGGNNYGFTSYFTIDPKKKWGFVLFTNSEYGEEFGGELSLYMLAGPDHTKLYLVLGLILLTIITGLVLLVRYLLRQRKKIKANIQE